MKLNNLFLLCEARKNPTQNKKIHIKDVLYNLLVQTTDKIYNIPNLFISLTQIDKIGVNPQSTYNTPIGIYCYPMSYVKEICKDSDLSKLPFAGKSTYVNVFNIRGNIVNLSDMTTSELEGWKKQLKALCIKYNINSPFIDHYHKLAISDERTKQCPGGHFWYITMKLAGKLSHSFAHTPKIWNKIFRELNIDGCLDLGKGIIHTNEPVQLVAFHIRAIHNNDRYINTVI